MAKAIRHYPKDNPAYWEFAVDDKNGWHIIYYCSNCDHQLEYTMKDGWARYCSCCGERITYVR